ncbi:MAG: transglutaminase domain-containing protein [Kiritimatiellae bacterium]|nr:transglutaminase domain-containing protein [Kiritimatiellia bacterium]
MRHSWIYTLSAVVCACLLSGCGTNGNEPSVPSVVTGDIQAGIERHIAEQVETGGGYFHVPFEDGELKLRLVRVHVEYLATLGPRRHFACVDMVGIDGEFYDVDFFLAGDPGAMTVTETMVHKINGQPLYVWEQNPDKTWVRTPVEEADAALLGVVTGRDAFEFHYQAIIPELSGPARMWLPVATSDDAQKVAVKSIAAPGRREFLRDSRYGNEILYLALGPEDGGKTVDIVYGVERVEKAAYAGDPHAAHEHLEPEAMVPLSDTIREAAEGAVAGKQGDLMRARALYDLVIDEMRYQKAGEGWGRGDAEFACDARFGNCTDYHSYFVALCRAVGIPARFAIGAAIPSERDEGGVDGYHCWAEFYAEGRWWPVDISEADKFTSLSAYYFGHHPANRIELSRGRELVVEPGPESGPINFLAYPVLEVGGQPVKAAVRFFFTRRPA